MDLTRFPHEEVIPIVYASNFRDPGGYFLSTNMQMRNYDVLFVANAPSVEVTKFLQLFYQGASVTAQGSLTGFYISGIR